MEAFDTASIVELEGLPPMIFGVIRWNKYIGRPAGDLCSGFNIRVEEHTATQYRALGGGKYEAIPGTGIWKDVVDPLSCRESPDEGDYHKLSFQIWGRGIHLNAAFMKHARALDFFNDIDPYCVTRPCLRLCKILPECVKSGRLLLGPRPRHLAPQSYEVALDDITHRPIQLPVKIQV